MRAPLSIVIPTLNAETVLPDCLAALTEGVQAGVIRELILTDGGSDDQTLAIAEEVGARVIDGPASRGGQLRRGAAVAEGDWLLFLHADTRLSPGWSEAVFAAMPRPGAYYGQLRFDATGLAPAFVAGWANLRSRIFGLPYGDQALLIDRSTYDSVGGYRDIPLMEDVALARMLRANLYPLGALAVTSAEKYQRQGWLRRGWRNLTTLALYVCGVAPDKLVQRYRR